MENREKVLAVVGIGVAAYLGYRYWYLPQKLRSVIASQAAAAGMSPDAYMAKIGAVACQGIGAYYGVPPQASGGVCGAIGGVAGSLAQQAPSWLTSIGQSAASSTLAAGQAFGGGISAIGAGGGSAIGSVASGIGSAARTVTDVSVYTTQKVGSTIKQGIVGASMLPVDVAKSVVGGVASGAKSIGHEISSWF